MMVALVLHAFATAQRSSRAIERHCCQDVAYRVITGNLIPDHATIARFICRHELALAELFGEALRLCDRTGLVKPGVVSIDGTRIAGNASPAVNHEFDQIAREILAEARATDEAEDELYREARGDELPEQLRTPEGRREFFRRAGQRLRREHKDSGLTEEPKGEASKEVPLELDAAPIVARTQGREGWSREGKRQLERHCWRHPDPIPRSRPERLLLAAERLEGELDVERRANEAYERYGATARDRLGRRLGGRPDPYRPPALPAGKVRPRRSAKAEPVIALQRGCNRWHDAWPRHPPTPAFEHRVHPPRSAASGNDQPTVRTDPVARRPRLQAQGAAAGRLVLERVARGQLRRLPRRPAHRKMSRSPWNFGVAARV